jgi:hypothetical protein
MGKGVGDNAFALEIGNSLRAAQEITDEFLAVSDYLTALGVPYEFDDGTPMLTLLDRVRYMKEEMQHESK